MNKKKLRQLMRQSGRHLGVASLITAGVMTVGANKAQVIYASENEEPLTTQTFSEMPKADGETEEMLPEAVQSEEKTDTVVEKQAETTLDEADDLTQDSTVVENEGDEATPSEATDETPTSSNTFVLANIQSDQTDQDDSEAPSKTDLKVSMTDDLDQSNKNLIDQITGIVKSQHVNLQQMYVGIAGDVAIDEANKALGGQSADKLNPNGYLITTGDWGDLMTAVIEGKDATGLSYALNQFIDTLNNKKDVSNLNVYESPQMSIRGVIEGFYGYPWSHQARKDLFAFMNENRMNTYIYSPKDDSYLRMDWKKLYPQDKLDEIKDLVDTAKENHVTFVYTLSPGNDITYSSEEDYQTTIKKFEQLRSIGVEQFYIALDDIPLDMRAEDRAKFPNRPSATYPNNGWSGLADAQAYYLNEVQAYIKAHNLPSLWLVPTNYNGSARDPFKEAQGEKLDPDIKMQWTGEGVFSKVITSDSIARAKQTYNSKHFFIWDNYPVNDSNQDRLYLGPVLGRGEDLYKETEGFTANPMIQPYASWIGIGSYADYMWNADTYNPQETLERITKEMAGEDPKLQEALTAFVDLNQSWDYSNDFAKAPILSGLIKNYSDTFGTEGHEKAKEALIEHLNEIANGPETLKKIAVSGFYTDALPWINAASHWAKASLEAVNVLEQVSAQSDLNSLDSSLEAIKDEIAAATVKALPNFRVTDPTPVTVPKVGDGVFEALTAMAHVALDGWLKITGIPDDAKAKTGEASTEIPQYQNYGISNASDGRLDTKFWSSRNVETGDKVKFTFPEVTPVQRIVLHQGPNDEATSGDMFGKASVWAATKDDDSDLVKIGALPQSGNAELILDKPIQVKYLYFIAEEPTNYWLQVRDLSVYSVAGSILKNITVGNGTISNAFDQKLETNLNANLTELSEPGTLGRVTDKPIEGAKTVIFVGKAKGRISVLSDGEWKQIGVVDGNKPINFLPFNLAKVTGLKIDLDKNSPAFDIQDFGFSTLTVAEKPTINDLKDTDNTISGLGHPLDTITIVRNQTVLGTTTVNEDGTWTYQLPEKIKLSSRDKLHVLAFVDGAFPSQSNTVTVQKTEDDQPIGKVEVEKGDTHNVFDFEDFGFPKEQMDDDQPGKEDPTKPHPNKSEQTDDKHTSVWAGFDKKDEDKTDADKVDHKDKDVESNKADVNTEASDKEVENEVGDKADNSKVTTLTTPSKETSSSSTVTKKSAQLPQTGMDLSNTNILVELGVLLLSTGIFALRKRQDD